MFINNKYTKWYYRIIESANKRNNVGYIEKHHIIPSCLGGSNRKYNIVELLPREHYICHLLLTKMTAGNDKYKMIFALSMMHKVKNIGEGRYVPSNKMYEYARKQFKMALTNYWTDENRRIHSEKISKVTTGRKVTDETKEKLRNKEWTDIAIANRLKNCLSNGAKRKGTKNPEHGELIFHNYVNANADIIKQIWELYDSGNNRRKISLMLGITWDRVGLAIKKREQIQRVFDTINNRVV